MTFLDSLRAVDPARQAIFSASGGLTFGGIVSAAEEIAGSLGGRLVALNTSAVASAVVALAAADGRSQAVAIIPPSTTPGTSAQLIRACGADIVLGDEAGTAPGKSALLPLTWVEALRQAHEGRYHGGTTAWIMTTSGTTGVPKQVAHTFGGLTRTTRTDREKGRGQVWGLLYDYTRFAGLQVMLQSLMSGACLAVPPHGAKLEQQLQFFADCGCTHLSATPTMWRKILMTPAGAALPLRQITLGGEIADDKILATLSRVYPMARITHIFASTEAGVGFSVTDRRAGFPAHYLMRPPAGIELKISEGRLWVRNTEVNPSYLGDRGSFAVNGWVDTGDLVDEVDGRVYFRGRASGVINVGGNKVNPEFVEQALLEHPHVSMARVSAKPNPIMGALVQAEIVPTAGAPEGLEKELMSFLRGRLERHMVPGLLRVVEQLPTGASGKINRNT